MSHDATYLNLVKKVLSEGKLRENRTGTNTISLFGEQVRYDLRQGFPLLTTKKVHFKGVVGELLWFLEGNTNAKYLKEKYGTGIWDEWADYDGELGPVYGKQWRDWKILDESKVTSRSTGIEYTIRGEITEDQIATVIKQIKESPNDRGIIVSAWNVADLPHMALRPCHTMFQFYVDGDELDLQLYQRSADLFLGVPFNIASYALLLTMVAQVCGKKPRYFIHTLGDVHIYTNHFDQLKEQIRREPRPAPKLFLSPGVDDIDKFTMGDIVLLDYDPHPAIKGEVAV